MIPNLPLGQRIVHYRKKRGWSQVQAAKTMGVQRTSLSRWENGREVPSGGNMTKLRDHLDLPIGTNEVSRESMENTHQLLLPFDRRIDFELTVTPKEPAAVQFQVRFKNIAS